MHSLTLFIDDERYTVPTLLILFTADLADAERLARQKLDEAPEHLHVHVFEGDRLVCSVSRDPETRDR